MRFAKLLRLTQLSRGVARLALGLASFLLEVLEILRLPLTAIRLELELELGFFRLFKGARVEGLGDEL